MQARRPSKSRLESYESILEALLNQPLPTQRLASETRLDCAVLRRHLEFLSANGLIEQRHSENTETYAITEKGLAVIKVIDFQKYLRKIQGTIRVVDEALKAIHEISDKTRH